MDCRHPLPPSALDGLDDRSPSPLLIALLVVGLSRPASPSAPRKFTDPLWALPRCARARRSATAHGSAG